MDFISEERENCSACQCTMDVSVLPPFTNVECPECGEHNRVKSDVGGYVLMKRQGIGGMSLVFGAVDKTLGREVAIKVLNEEYSMDEKRIEQFEQEARTTASLSHPHIVKVFTVGQAYNRFFIAMELISGDSLEQKMADGGPLSESAILGWARQIADGLNAANEAGLIHRDIKPGNILFDKKGHVKIVDFGLALVTKGGKAQADEIWATPYYVSPEALDVREEDFRSDIYALGASLFHALTGNPPFATESRATVELKEIKRKLPSLSKVAPWLSAETCAIIDRAMAFEVEDRFTSYQELIYALQYAESVISHGGERPPMNSAERAQRRIKMGNGRNWKIPTMIVVGALAVGGVLFTVFKEKKEAGNDDLKPVSISDESNTDHDTRVETQSKRVAREIALARESLQNGNYAEAAWLYGQLARGKNIPKDTVYWAGLQAATVYWLNGQPTKARSELSLLSKSRLAVEGVGSEVGTRLEQAVESFKAHGKIRSSSFPVIENEMDANIAFASGLKNWEDGYFDEALLFFNKVESFREEESSLELELFRAKIAGYKHDALLTSALRNSYVSEKSMAELSNYVSDIQEMKGKLQTKGRMASDLERREMKAQRHRKSLIREAEERLSGSSEKSENNAGKAKSFENPPTWATLRAQIQENLRSCKFHKVERLLRKQSFPTEEDNDRVTQMIYLCKNASEFKVMVQRSLSKRIVNVPLTLKDGKPYYKTYGASNKGFQIMDNGNKSWIKWSDIVSEDLVGLYRYIREEELSDFEKNLRLEYAICFAYLIGENQKAQTAANALSKVNPLFKNYWEQCMNLLRE